MTKETADTVALLQRFAEVIPSTNNKAIALLCETTAATIHLRASLLPREGEPAPQPYARVHAMGHNTYLGPVVMLARGIRVEHHTVEQVDDGAWGIVRQWKDVLALHSIEYLGEAEWAREGEQLGQEVTRRNEEHRRRSADPKGYSLHMKSAMQYGFVTPTGEVWGWWYSTSQARANAWTHADGEPEEVEGSPQGKVGDQVETHTDQATSDAELGGEG